MAGRSEARIYASVWDDPDFLDLSPDAQRLYFFLISQADLAHCGVIPLRPRRWARKAKGLSVDAVCAAVAELAEGGFVITDEETGELFVRALVRRDKVLRQPFLFQGLAASAAMVESPEIRAALVCELVRTRGEGGVNQKIAEDLDDLIRSLADGPDTHPDRHPGTHPQCLSDTHQDSHPGTHQDSHPGTHPDSHPATLAGSHPRPQQGEGGRYYLADNGPPFPNPQSPSPRRDGPRRDIALWPAAVPPLGEGDQDPGPNPADIDAFVDEIRKIRQDWTRASIHRAVTNDRCRERGWELTQSAAMIVARDPESVSPGRLPEDGGWWRSAAVRRATLTATGTRPVTCQVHRVEHPPGAECGSCAADRKAAS